MWLTFNLSSRDSTANLPSHANLIQPPKHFPKQVKRGFQKSNKLQQLQHPLYLPVTASPPV